MSLTRQQMLAEMEQALADEIAAQNQHSSAHHTATHGQLLTAENGQYIYTFMLEDFWDAPDDTPLKTATTYGEENRCSVVTVRGTLITIASNGPLPDDLLQRIDFIDDSTELLKRLRVALKQTKECASQLASKSFGLITPQPAILAIEKQLSPQTTLRERQQLAASKALGGEVSFIVGPPGTGKTLTLAAIALTHLRQGRTVLIAAQTNIAVDNAIMKLCDLCKEAGRSDLLTQGRVIRFGVVQKAELKGDSYQEVYLPSIVQQLNAQLQKEYDQYKRDLDALKQQIGMLSQQTQMDRHRQEQILEQARTRCQQLQASLRSQEALEQHHQAALQTQQEQYYRELQQLERLWREASQQLAQAKAFLMEQSNAHIKAKQQEQDLFQRLLQARAMNKIQRLLHAVHLERLEQQAGEATYRVNQLLASLQTAQEHEARHQKQMQTLEPRIKAAQESMKHIDQQLHTPSEHAIKIAAIQSMLTQEEAEYQQQKIALEQNQRLQQSNIEMLNKRHQHLTERQATLEHQIREKEQTIVKNARIIGTTLTKTYMSQAINNRRFDAVILDEVSMAPLPLIYLAAAHAEQSTTFIGDPQQLAPIVTADTELANNWLKRDLFHWRDITLDAASRGICHSTLLNVQSRMHPQIAKIANVLIYQNKLHHDFDESEHKCFSPLPDAPLILCDTQDAAPTVSRPPNGKSRRNYYHALCCLELAKKILNQLPDTSLHTTPVIGILSPYAPQARLIQRLIKEAELEHVVQVGTIHRFQGLEFDIVIFDTVESPGLRPGDFISGSTGTNTMRMLNVAITRARHKLLIVAHQRHILQEFPETAIMKQVVQCAAQSAICSSLDVIGIPLAIALQQASKQYRSPEQVLAHALKTPLLIASPNETTTIEHYNEKTFYEACKRDIRRANQSIIIASPFLTPHRVNELLPLLIEKQQQGVKVIIYAKPLKEYNKQWHKEAADILHDKGLQLTYRYGMHQKAIIVDERILYLGSLNALSQRESGEIMARMLGQVHIIKALLEDLQTPATYQQNIPSMTENEIRQLQSIFIPILLLPEIQSSCRCGSNFIPRLIEDRGEVFYGCENYSKCSYQDTVRLTKDHLRQIQSVRNRKCDSCKNIFELQFQDKPQLILLSCKNEQCKEKQHVVFQR